MSADYIYRMPYLKTVRDAVVSEIQSLTSQRAKLELVLKELEGEPAADPSTRNRARQKEAGAKAARVTRRLRLTDDTRNTIAETIVKAAKAHKSGASKQDIIKYLDTSGYRLGVNYNELHLFAILNTLRGGDEPRISTTGEKVKMRYHRA